MNCRRGHALSADNLNTSGRCRTCHRAANREAYEARRAGVAQKIPSGPLADLITRQSQLFADGQSGVVGHIAANLGTEDLATIERLVHRVCRPGHTILRSTADRLCIGLGTHPLLVYGRDWETA